MEITKAFPQGTGGARYEFWPWPPLGGHSPLPVGQEKRELACRGCLQWMPEEELCRRCRQCRACHRCPGDFS